RERLARIYNGSAQQLVNNATFVTREREAGRAVPPEQTAAGERELAQGLDFLEKARAFTAEEVARGEDDVAWLGVHAWTLHNLGVAKLIRSAFVADGGDLDESVADLRQAAEIRDRIVREAPTNGEWKIDLLWTQICLNEAMATRARRDKDY